MPKQASNKKLKTADYELLGRMMERVYEYNYANRWRMYLMSFAKGVAGGFGGVIGATVVVALVLWILTLFDSIPFIPDITSSIRDTLNSSE